MKNLNTYIKYNESRNRKDSNTHSDRLSEFRDKWQKFEDEQPWDFDYFWSKLEAYNNDWQNRFQNTDDVEYIIYLQNYDDYSVYNRSDSSGGLKFDIREHDDYARKTGYIEAYVKTGGYSGGSCWDDDENYARPFETDNYVEVDDLIKFIEHILCSIIGKNPMGVLMTDLIQKLRGSNLIQEDEWTSYEYYGNSDDYRSYFITLWDLYVFLAKEQVF